jgi:DnaK suppressor protein
MDSPGKWMMPGLPWRGVLQMKTGKREKGQRVRMRRVNIDGALPLPQKWGIVIDTGNSLHKGWIMTDRQRASLRKIMLAEMEELRLKITQMEEQVVSVAPDTAIGRISRMDTIINQGISRSAMLSNKQRLMKLERALRRLADPDFGECSECGEAIPMARLLALPESDLCVHCAE